MPAMAGQGRSAPTPTVDSRVRSSSLAIQARNCAPGPRRRCGSTFWQKYWGRGVLGQAARGASYHPTTDQRANYFSWKQVASESVVADEVAQLAAARARRKSGARYPETVDGAYSTVTDLARLRGL